MLARVWTIIKAEINELLDRAEDPEKLLKQYIRDAEEQLAEVKNALAAQIAAEMRAKKQLEEARKKAEDYRNDAKLALASGKEDLARRALAESKKYEQQIPDLEHAYKMQQETTTELRSTMDQLSNKLEEMRTKERTLSARAKAAKAREGAAKALGNLRTDEAFAGFARMEDKVEALEARAKANEALNTSSLDEELAELKKATDIDDELAKLKAELEAEKDQQNR